MELKIAGQSIALPNFIGQVNGSDRAFLARQIATMLTSGLPVNKAIGLLAGQAHKKALQEALAGMQHELETGATFSMAASRYPHVFNRVFVSVALAGEQVGRLAEVLTQLAEQLERESKFTSKVRSALMYPMFIIVAMVGAGILMMVNIVPQLKTIFEDAGTELPWTTQTIISISGFLEHFWWLAILGLGVAVIATWTYLTSKAGERFWSWIQISLPGGLGIDIAMARFARTLSMLVQSGTPIIEALAVTGEVIDNVFYRELLSSGAEQVKRGIPLSVPLRRSRLVPAIVGQMVEVGEQTGQLDRILENLSAYYEQESDTKIQQVSSLIEPVIILVVGCAIGFLVYSVIVPLYNIAQL